MYTIDEVDRVVEASEFPEPTTGPAAPTILSDSTGCVLSYRTRTRTICVIKFGGVESLTFGAPNDEVLQSHPLFQRGLSSYSVARVHGSSWVRALERANSAHPQHDRRHFSALAHFIFTFHDETLEVCAAQATLVGYVHDDQDVVADMGQALASTTV